MRIFTSLSSIPPRQKNLKISLESIVLNQTVLPTMTVLNICDTYHRFPDQTIEPANILNNSLIEVNRTEDNGPLTKILGFLDFYEKNLSSEKNDILIIHDDDIVYKNFLIESLTCPIRSHEKDVVTHLYGEGLNMYSSDMDDNLVKSNFVYPCLPGYLGICFRINQKIVKDMKEYIGKIITEIPESKYHDDAIITSYLRSRNNRIFWIRRENIAEGREDLVGETDSLCSRENEQKNRHEISYKILDFMSKANL